MFDLMFAVHQNQLYLIDHAEDGQRETDRRFSRLEKRDGRHFAIVSAICAAIAIAGAVVTGLAAYHLQPLLAPMQQSRELPVP